MKIGTIPDGIDRVIIGYHRLDLGQPVVGKYVNNNRRRSITFHSLVPGAKYRITAWGLGGNNDSTRIRSHSPTVVEIVTRQQGKLIKTLTSVYSAPPLHSPKMGPAILGIIKGVTNIDGWVSYTHAHTQSSG